MVSTISTAVREQGTHTLVRALGQSGGDGSRGVILRAGLLGAVADAILEVDLGADAGHFARGAAQILSQVHHVAEAFALRRSVFRHDGRGELLGELTYAALRHAALGVGESQRRDERENESRLHFGDGRREAQLVTVSWYRWVGRKM